MKRSDARLRAAFKIAEAGGDQATMDLLIGRMEASDKAAWMLRSHLENAGEDLAATATTKGSVNSNHTRLPRNRGKVVVFLFGKGGTCGFARFAPAAVGCTQRTVQSRYACCSPRISARRHRLASRSPTTRCCECERCTLVFADPMRPGDVPFYEWVSSFPAYHAESRWEWASHAPHARAAEIRAASRARLRRRTIPRLPGRPEACRSDGYRRLRRQHRARPRSWIEGTPGCDQRHLRQQRALRHDRHDPCARACRKSALRDRELQAAASSRGRDHVLGSLFADFARISSLRHHEFAAAPFDPVEHGVAALSGGESQSSNSVTACESRNRCSIAPSVTRSKR